MPPSPPPRSGGRARQGFLKETISQLRRFQQVLTRRQKVQQSKLPAMRFGSLSPVPASRHGSTPPRSPLPTRPTASRRSLTPTPSVLRGMRPSARSAPPPLLPRGSTLTAAHKDGDAVLRQKKPVWRSTSTRDTTTSPHKTKPGSTGVAGAPASRSRSTMKRGSLPFLSSSPPPQEHGITREVQMSSEEETTATDRRWRTKLVCTTEALHTIPRRASSAPPLQRATYATSSPPNAVAHRHSGSKALTSLLFPFFPPSRQRAQGTFSISPVRRMRFSLHSKGPFHAVAWEEVAPPEPEKDRSGLQQPNGGESLQGASGAPSHHRRCLSCSCSRSSQRSRTPPPPPPLRHTSHSRLSPPATSSTSSARRRAAKKSSCSPSVKFIPSQRSVLAATKSPIPTATTRRGGTLSLTETSSFPVPPNTTATGGDDVDFNFASASLSSPRHRHCCSCTPRRSLGRNSSARQSPLAMRSPSCAPPPPPLHHPKSSRSLSRSIGSSGATRTQPTTTILTSSHKGHEKMHRSPRAAPKFGGGSTHHTTTGLELSRGVHLTRSPGKLRIPDASSPNTPRADVLLASSETTTPHRAATVQQRPKENEEREGCDAVPAGGSTAHPHHTFDWVVALTPDVLSSKRESPAEDLTVAVKPSAEEKRETPTFNTNEEEANKCCASFIRDSSTADFSLLDHTCLQPEEVVKGAFDEAGSPSTAGAHSPASPAPRPVSAHGEATDVPQNWFPSHTTNPPPQHPITTEGRCLSGECTPSFTSKVPMMAQSIRSLFGVAFHHRSNGSGKASDPSASPQNRSPTTFSWKWPAAPAPSLAGTEFSRGRTSSLLPPAPAPSLDPTPASVGRWSGTSSEMYSTSLLPPAPAPSLAAEVRLGGLSSPFIEHCAPCTAHTTECSNSMDDDKPISGSPPLRDSDLGPAGAEQESIARWNPDEPAAMNAGAEDDEEPEPRLSATLLRLLRLPFHRGKRARSEVVSADGLASSESLPGPPRVGASPSIRLETNEDHPSDRGSKRAGASTRSAAVDRADAPSPAHSLPPPRSAALSRELPLPSRGSNRHSGTLTRSSSGGRSSGRRTHGSEASPAPAPAPSSCGRGASNHEAEPQEILAGLYAAPVPSSSRASPSLTQTHLEQSLLACDDSSLPAPRSHQPPLPSAARRSWLSEAADSPDTRMSASSTASREDGAQRTIARLSPSLTPAHAELSLRACAEASSVPRPRSAAPPSVVGHGSPERQPTEKDDAPPSHASREREEEEGRPRTIALDGNPPEEPRKPHRFLPPEFCQLEREILAIANRSSRHASPRHSEGFRTTASLPCIGPVVEEEHATSSCSIRAQLLQQKPHHTAKKKRKVVQFHSEADEFDEAKEEGAKDKHEVDEKLPEKQATQSIEKESREACSATKVSIMGSTEATSLAPPSEPRPQEEDPPPATTTTREEGTLLLSTASSARNSCYSRTSEEGIQMSSHNPKESEEDGALPHVVAEEHTTSSSCSRSPDPKDEEQPQYRLEEEEEEAEGPVVPSSSSATAAPAKKVGMRWFPELPSWRASSTRHSGAMDEIQKIAKTLVEAAATEAAAVEKPRSSTNLLSEEHTVRVLPNSVLQYPHCDPPKPLLAPPLEVPRCSPMPFPTDTTTCGRPAPASVLFPRKKRDHYTQTAFPYVFPPEVLTSPDLLDLPYPVSLQEKMADCVQHCHSHELLPPTTYSGPASEAAGGAHYPSLRPLPHNTRSVGTSTRDALPTPSSATASCRQGNSVAEEGAPPFSPLALDISPPPSHPSLLTTTRHRIGYSSSSTCNADAERLRALSHGKPLPRPPLQALHTNQGAEEADGTAAKQLWITRSDGCRRSREGERGGVKRPRSEEDPDKENCTTTELNVTEPNRRPREGRWTPHPRLLDTLVTPTTSTKEEQSISEHTEKEGESSVIMTEEPYEDGVQLLAISPSRSLVIPLPSCPAPHATTSPSPAFFEFHRTSTFTASSSSRCDAEIASSQPRNASSSAVSSNPCEYTPSVPCAPRNHKTNTTTTATTTAPAPAPPLHDEAALPPAAGMAPDRVRRTSGSLHGGLFSFAFTSEAEEASQSFTVPRLATLLRSVCFDASPSSADVVASPTPPHPLEEEQEVEEEVVPSRVDGAASHDDARDEAEDNNKEEEEAEADDMILSELSGSSSEETDYEADEDDHSALVLTDRQKCALFKDPEEYDMKVFEWQQQLQHEPEEEEEHYPTVRQDGDGRACPHRLDEKPLFSQGSWSPSRTVSPLGKESAPREAQRRPLRGTGKQRRGQKSASHHASRKMIPRVQRMLPKKK